MVQQVLRVHPMAIARRLHISQVYPYLLPQRFITSLTMLLDPQLKCKVQRKKNEAQTEVDTCQTRAFCIVQNTQCGHI